MHFTSFNFRHKSGNEKTASLSSSSSKLEPVPAHAQDPFLPHLPLPVTSIANIVLDPGNLNVLYQTATVPNTSSSMESTGSDTTDAASPSPSLHISSLSDHVSAPFSPHHPHTSITDLVFNSTTLSALYEAKEAERNAAAQEELSGTRIESGKTEKTPGKQ
ncbi:hypothetical protein F5050DRAFT_1124353 [Lentinula boryana]|uniref:Uncharacterized protein n=1 Tax=Lentinula boryana TaxID=40481 RepID=A0ABQ8PYU1_9AGAR|nr:hypothetical protein F5050DRAFT_1124353 [Lentinula boryana]